MSAAMGAQPKTTLAKAALDYAKRGIPVFPCRPGTKVPACPNGFKAATIDTAQIVQWWAQTPDANIGTVPAQSGHLVLDLDRGHDPQDVAALPPTRRTQTPSGGAHLWFTTDQELGNRLFASHIDVRSANGYVLVPPSIIDARDAKAAADPTRCGQYVWGQGVPTAPLPESVLAKLLGKASDRVRDETVASGEPVSEHRLREVLSWLDPEKEPVWFSRLGSIKSTPLPNDEDFAIRRQIAREWSAGRLDRHGRYAFSPPSSYEGDDVVDERFNRLDANKPGGAGFGSLVHAARLAGMGPEENLADSSARFGEQCVTGRLTIILGDLTDSLKNEKSPNRFGDRTPEEDAACGKSEIKLMSDYLCHAVDAGERALLEQGADIYQQHGRIVRAVLDPQSKRPPLITTLTVAAVREELTKAAVWLRFDGRKKKRVAVNCPEDVATTLLSRDGKWKLRPLHGLLNAPTLRADGSLLNQPGYDAESGLLLMPGGISVTVPDRPTKDDAIAALAVLKGVIKDFPFVSDADRAVWLSGVLTAVMRRTLETAPLHGISATMPGSGKGKLVDMVAMIATGARAESITQGRDTAETEKRIIAAYLRGGLVLSIDNCTTPLDGGDTLSQILTQPTPTIRPLGTSKAVTIEANIALFCNGNNLIIAGENVRRSLRCKLDPGVEHPEQRSFDVEPVSHVRQHRGKYLTAALTILCAHFAAGQPGQPSTPLGSFEQWSRSVRAALLWLGEEDPVTTQVALRQDNPDAEVLHRLLHAWYEVYQSTPVLAREVADEGLTTVEYERFALHDAVIAATAGKPAGLSYYLRSKAGQIQGGLRFQKAGVDRTHTHLWQVQPVF